MNALEEIQKRHGTATPRGKDVRKMEKPYSCRKVLFTCSNGWTIEQLVPNDYALEGWFMGHCLGGKDAAGSHAVASLREPDGTPHITFTQTGGGAHGRCNAFPKKYASFINEWRVSLGYEPYTDAQVAQLANGSWGEDTDDKYHEKHVMDDRDYRDLPYGSMWRDAAWRQKRGTK